MSKPWVVFIALYAYGLGYWQAGTQWLTTVLLLTPFVWTMYQLIRRMPR